MSSYLTHFIILSLLFFLKSATSKRPIEFQDYFSSKFHAHGGSLHWISPDTFVFEEDSIFYTSKINITEPENYENNFNFTTNFYAKKPARDSSYIFNSDLTRIAFQTDVVKNWRHSHNSTWEIYSLPDQVFVTKIQDVQHFQFSPSPKNGEFCFIKNNNLFLGGSTGQTVQVTSTGEKETIFNGKPDWVYEEEVVGTDNLLHWVSDGEFLVYVILDDSRVDHIKFEKYNSDYHYDDSSSMH